MIMNHSHNRQELANVLLEFCFKYNINIIDCKVIPIHITYNKMTLNIEKQQNLRYFTKSTY